MPQTRMKRFILLLEHLAWVELQFLSGIRDSRKAGSLWGMMRGKGGVRKSIHQSWLPRGLGLLGRGSLGRDQYSWNRATGISTMAIHESTTPTLSQTIWPRWASRQFLTVPIVQTLVPVTFGYSLSSEAVVRRESRRWKRLWQRSHKRTSMGPSTSCWNGITSALQPEGITSKDTRVSFVYYQ